MKEALFFCIVGLPLFGKEGSGTPVFKILVRALCLITLFCISSTACFTRGIEDFELEAIKYLSNFHHCLGDSESDFNLVAMLLLNDCYDSRNSCVTLLRKFLNLVQCIGRLVCFALL